MTINVWSDSMQHIELLGKPALFSDSRVDRSTVPDGWYVYDLRGSDYDPDLISTLEARVIVNYAGSILTPEPVIFPDGQDYLDVKGQTDFLDEEITLIDFCRQHEMPIPSRYQIRPASFDEAGLFYAMKPEEDQRLGCIGHVRMDFGHRGKEFWHTWWPRGPEELNSPEFKAELQQVVDELRTGVLKDLSSMSKYCWSHGGEVGNWPSNYGYIVETENYRYCLRCNPVPGDYQAYVRRPRHPRGKSRLQSPGSRISHRYPDRGRPACRSTFPLAPFVSNWPENRSPLQRSFLSFWQRASASAYTGPVSSLPLGFLHQRPLPAFHNIYSEKPPLPPGRFRCPSWRQRRRWQDRCVSSYAYTSFSARRRFHPRFPHNASMHLL